MVPSEAAKLLEGAGTHAEGHYDRQQMLAGHAAASVLPSRLHSFLPAPFKHLPILLSILCTIGNIPHAPINPGTLGPHMVAVHVLWPRRRCVPGAGHRPIWQQLLPSSPAGCFSLPGTQGLHHRPHHLAGSWRRGLCSQPGDSSQQHTSVNPDMLRSFVGACLSMP